MKYLIMAFALLPITTACAQEEAQDNSTSMTTPTCETYVEWTGQNIEDIDLSVLGDRSYRVVKPDSMVTMDYRPDRLNIKTDESGTIITQECG